MADDKELLLGCLLLQTHLLDGLCVLGGAAVQDGDLGGVDLNEHIVHAGGVECGHGVFDGAHLHIVLGNDGAAVCGHNILGHGLDDGHTRQVNTLYGISVPLGGGIEPSLDLQAGMKPLALDGKGSFES